MTRYIAPAGAKNDPTDSIATAAPTRETKINTKELIR